MYQREELYVYQLEELFTYLYSCLVWLGLSQWHFISHCAHPDHVETSSCFQAKLELCWSWERQVVTPGSPALQPLLPRPAPSRLLGCA